MVFVFRLVTSTVYHKALLDRYRCAISVSPSSEDIYTSSLECVIRLAMNLKSSTDACDGIMIICRSKSTKISYKIGPKIDPLITPKVHR